MVTKPLGKRPKHFKVHCSVQNHEKTAAMAADNDLFALWVRLGILAVERFANKTDDSFIVSDRELPRLTGKYRADVARTLLRRLADVTPTSAEREGDVWRITIPNFSKKQMFGRPDDPSVSPSYSDSYSDPHSSSEEEKRREAAASPLPTALTPDPPVDPPPEKIRKKPKSQLHSLTDPLSDKLREHVRQRAFEFCLDPTALEVALLDWALGADRQYADWNRQLGTMLRSRWDWTKPLFAQAGHRTIERESAAEGRERRTKDAMAEAFRRMTGSESGSQPPLIALAGGRE